MQRINVDTIGPLPMDKNGFRYIVVIIDTFTRYMNTYRAKTLEGDECAVILNWFVARYGVPDEIVTDNGGQFINNHLQYLMELIYTKNTW
jgi:transposase InsO family protein